MKLDRNAAASLSLSVITVLAAVLFGGCAGKFPAPPPSPALQSIAVTAASASVAAGLTDQMTATGTFSDGSTQNLTSTVVWTSGVPASATIVSSGLATAVATGTSVITAASGNISGQATLTITAPLLKSIGVTATSASVAAGLTDQMTATGTFTDKSTQNLTASVTWNSTTSSVATIAASGLASTLVEGTSLITASSSGVSGSLTLTVNPPALVSIAVTAANPSLTTGGTDQLTATGTYTDTSTQNLTASAVWTSTNPSAVTMSASTTGLADAVAAGKAIVDATVGSIQGSLALTVLIPVRRYSGSASVGDFLSITVDPNQGTLTYNNLSNSQTGTVSWVANSGGATLSDPSGHVLAVSEVPNFGFVAIVNNAGPTADQLALVTSVVQQNIQASDFFGAGINAMQFRTRGGGVGISSLSVDNTGSVTNSDYMPFGKLSPNNSGFDSGAPFQLPIGPPAPYLLIQNPPPPQGSGNSYAFGTPSGMFLNDNEDGSAIGLPKAASKAFNASWAGTYTLSYYEKSNANGPDGNSPEAGDISWGQDTLNLDNTGHLTLTDAKGNPVVDGTLAAVADTPSLYNGVATTGPQSPGELGDPCYGVFTFTVTAGTGAAEQSQQIFAAFADGVVLLSGFSTNVSFNPGDSYSYFYGVGLPQSQASTTSNGASSAPAGGSSTANPPGGWNSLSSVYSTNPSAPRAYVGSSAMGDLLSITIDPVSGTLAYYDYNNGNRSGTSSNGVSTIGYSFNANGVSTVTDPSGHVSAVQELPGQLLLLAMNNTGFSGVNLSPTLADDPPMLVVATPVMNLTTEDFAGQNYNFIQMRATEGDLTVGAFSPRCGRQFLR